MTRSRNGLLPLAAALVAAILAGLVAPGEGYVLNILMQAATYAVSVLGIVIVLGYCGQISLAQAAFFGIGAYGVAVGTTSFGLPFAAAIVVGIVIATLFGAILGLASLRLGGHYLAMVTISFQVILTLVLTNWIGLTRGPDGVANIPRPAGLAHGPAYLALCLATLVLCAWATWRLRGTRLGRAMFAVRDNEIAAGTTGVDTFRTKVVAFAISAFLGSLGGGLFAGAFAYISPDQFSFNESVVMLTMALLGGVQSPFGALLGTLLLVILPEWLRFLKQVYLAVYGGAVILIMVFLPDGIWGWLMARLRRPRPAPAAAAPPLPLLSRTGAPTEDIIFDIKGLAKHFGGLRAVDGVDIAIRRGTVHALIGPNGSGKSTLINVVTGLYRATAGQVLLQGRDITGLLPHTRAGLGMARTFQNIRLFRGLTVLENAMVGAERPGADLQDHLAVEARALAALDVVGLRADASRFVTELSYGHQRSVEIARALAGEPAILLLDEPAAGLNTTEKAELGRLLRRLKGHGLTILIVDHDMALVEQVADRITVLNFGRRIADGPTRETLANPDVVAAYLGEPRQDEAA